MTQDGNGCISETADKPLTNHVQQEATEKKCRRHGMKDFLTRISLSLVGKSLELWRGRKPRPPRAPIDPKTKMSRNDRIVFFSEVACRTRLPSIVSLWHD